MPVISRFHGIVIRMYFQQSEHNPPHVHVRYGSNVAAITISDAMLIEGYLPPKELSLVTSWVLANTDELLEIWNTQEFHRIPPP